MEFFVPMSSYRIPQHLYRFVNSFRFHRKSLFLSLKIIAPTATPIQSTPFFMGPLYHLVRVGTQAEEKQQLIKLVLQNLGVEAR